MILRALGGMVRSFSNPDKLPSSTRTLEEVVCPPSLSKTAIREHWRVGVSRKCVPVLTQSFSQVIVCHAWQVFSHAVYHMFCCVLGRKLTSEELFAVQTLTRDPTPHSRNTKDTSMCVIVCLSKHNSGIGYHLASLESVCSDLVSCV